LDEQVQDIICYVRENDNPETQWRIALPEQMLDKTVAWFHQIMIYPGSKRLCETLQQHYHHPQLRRTKMTTSSVNTANNTNYLAKDMAYCQEEKCE